jgi:hypothetical protein
MADKKSKEVEKKGSLKTQAELDAKMNDVPYMGKTTLMVDEETGEPRKKPRVRKYGGASMFSNTPDAFKKGGAVKSSASKRADGCCVKGKTRGKMV